jgi:hypothetical protein
LGVGLNPTATIFDFMPKQYDLRKFYCTVCDNNVVDIDDESTGKVYTVYGHITKKDPTPDCATVLVCICNRCDKTDALVSYKNF